MKYAVRYMSQDDWDENIIMGDDPLKLIRKVKSAGCMDPGVCYGWVRRVATQLFNEHLADDERITPDALELKFKELLNGEVHVCGEVIGYFAVDRVW